MDNQRLTDDGVVITCATGRSWHTVHRVLGSFRFRLREGLSDQCEVTVQQDTYYPEDTRMAIVPPDVSQAAAPTMLAVTINADRLVVFGDDMNDIPPFEVATESYAVSNAAEVLGAAATSVVRSNAEDGVAQWLAEHATRPDTGSSVTGR